MTTNQERRQAAQRHLAAQRAAIDEAVRRLPPMGLDARVAEAERVLAERKAADRQAEELTAAAGNRYQRDAMAHARADLAARVVERHGINTGDDVREDLTLAAVVALELVERDRVTAEAKVRRVLAIVERLYVGASGPAFEVAREVLDAIGEPAADGGGEEQAATADVARGLLAGALHGAGAPNPVDLATDLVELLERAELVIVRRPL